MRITSNQQTTNRNPLATSRERDLLPEDQFLACIRKERHRSDRSRAVLSLISARLPKRGGSYDPGLEYALDGILHRIRSLDEVGWLEPGVVGVLLPETSKEGAWHLVKELQRNDLTGYLRNAEISVYSYPDSLDGGPSDGGNGRRERAERNGHERRTPRVEREPAPVRASAKESQPTQPLVGLLLDKEPWWKRPVDVAGASLALVLLSPLMLGAALAVKVSSPGPVFYSSWRVGKGGQKFRFHKFRTMCVDAEKQKKDLLAQNEASGPVFKMERDPRITPIGRILRKSSVDELPQLWNVLVGDMALVGPRPPIPEETIWYEPWQRRRLELKGGLTCLWQISGRSNVSFEEWCRLDVKYHENRSFLGDVGILFRTVPAVFTARGAK
jgi:lipopolysaccharide/colanic/teichoic acid biosynthesis glycosyltransferase